MASPGLLALAMSPPTFGHGPGADIGRHAAPLLGGVLVASLQLDTVAGEMTQPRDDQGLLVYHLLKRLALLRARGRASRGVGETGSCGHGRCHVGHVPEGPAFPRRPVMTAGHTHIHTRSCDRRLEDKKK